MRKLLSVIVFLISMVYLVPVGSAQIHMEQRYYPDTTCYYSNGTPLTVEDRKKIWECVNHQKPNDTKALKALVHTYLDILEQSQGTNAVIDSPFYHYWPKIDSLTSILETGQPIAETRKIRMKGFVIAYQKKIKAEGVVETMAFLDDSIAKHSTDSFLVSRLYVMKGNLIRSGSSSKKKNAKN